MPVDTLRDEEGRLCALYRLGLPGLGGHEALSAIAAIACDALGADGARISIVNRTHRIALAAAGAGETEMARAASLCALAIEGDEPFIVENVGSDTRIASVEGSDDVVNLGAYLALPLFAHDGYVLGCLEILSAQPRQFFSHEIELANSLASLASGQLNDRQPDHCDALTGVLTRRRFQAEVEREFDRSTRYERPAALVFLDIDGFGQINSAVGLRIADQVLKTVANRLNEAVRSSDTVARIGGEEFALMLPETLAYEASQCAERLRDEIARLRFRSPTGVVSVTASFGIAPLNPDIKSAIEWFAKADIAVYGSKQSGRNCVTFASPSADAEGTLGDNLAEPLMSRLH